MTTIEPDAESSAHGAAADKLQSAATYYAEMRRIRRFEEELYRLVSTGAIGGTTHLCIGQEAVPVGVSSLLTDEDQITSTHRGHGHLLAKGGRMDRALAEIAGRIDGYCQGKGGSQHTAIPSIGHMGSNGITGGGLPIAAGLALAQQQRGSDRVVIAYLGDGAADVGNFHETLNMAALWKLPLIFVLENNLYSMSTPVDRTSACESFADWATRYRGMDVARGDGNDVFAVAELVRPLVERARRGAGPGFAEFLTYRQSGHSKSDARVYRTREEEAEWKARDPLTLCVGYGLSPEQVAELDAEVEAELAEATEFALASEAGGRDVAMGELGAPILAAEARGPGSSDVETGAAITLTEAIREVLRGELRRDESCFVMGEDIGAYGGAFGVTRGLLDEFGDARIRETPICENSFTALGVGAATGGMRPVVELMFGDFVCYAMDALVNHAAKLRYMYAGGVRVPFTLRMPVGRRKGYGGTHSQSLEAWFVHTPGLWVAFPSTVEDAVGLLRTAIRCDAPTLFLEHKLLYPAKGSWPGDDYTLPFGQARVVREGSDLSLLSYGLCVSLCEQAAQQLESRGHSVEIVDLRTLQPFDRATCIASLQKTGRGIFVQEATGVAGVCDRVIADVLPDVFPWLHAPIEKVTGAHVPFPSSPMLEEHMMPNARDVFAACLRMLQES